MNLKQISSILAIHIRILFLIQVWFDEAVKGTRGQFEEGESNIVWLDQFFAHWKLFGRRSPNSTSEFNQKRPINPNQSKRKCPQSWHTEKILSSSLRKKIMNNRAPFNCRNRKNHQVSFCRTVRSTGIVPAWVEWPLGPVALSSVSLSRVSITGNVQVW